jgi:hypothetical protein
MFEVLSGDYEESYLLELKAVSSGKVFSSYLGSEINYPDGFLVGFLR